MNGQVEEIGAVALRLLRRGAGRGCVLGVFPRAAALEDASGEVLWMDRAPEALGPRGMTVDLPFEERLETGEAWKFEKGALQFIKGGVRLLVTGRVTTQRRAAPITIADLPTLGHRLVRLGLWPWGPLEDFFAASVGRFLDSMGTGGDRAAAAEALVGLGPGLTPSGDDFLGGFFLARRLLGRRDSRARWRVLDRARCATHPLSRALLSDHLAGSSTRAESRLLRALLGEKASEAELDAAVCGLVRFGATSGWDFVAGAAGAVELELVQRSVSNVRRGPTRNSRPATRDSGS